MNDNNNLQFIEFYGQELFLNLLSFLNNNKLYTGLKTEYKGDYFEITKVHYRDNSIVDIHVIVTMTLSVYSQNDTVVELELERIHLKSEDIEYTQWHLGNC